MATTNEIFAQAAHLGRLIGSHPAVQTYREVTRQLDLDINARNLLGQFEQLMEMLAMKEANMQPIEISEKKQAEQLQQSIALNPLLKRLMTAQVEYMELMKTVQSNINDGLTGKAPAPAVGDGSPAAEPAPSKIILG